VHEDDGGPGGFDFRPPGGEVAERLAAERSAEVAEQDDE